MKDRGAPDSGERRLRIAIGCVLCIQATVVLTFALWWHNRWQSINQAWEQAVAEAAQDTPRWRLHDLDADRGAIPDESNAAKLILQVHEEFPGQCTGFWTSVFENVLIRLEPPYRLDDEKVAGLRQLLGYFSSKITAVRELRHRPCGLYPLVSLEAYHLEFEHFNACSDIGEFLANDALCLAQEGKIDQALQSCHALFHVARSWERHPTVLALLHRVRWEVVAALMCEYVLSQGEAASETLQAFQESAQDNEVEAHFLRAARGERARVNHIFEQLRRGQGSQIFRSLYGLDKRPRNLADAAELWTRSGLFALELHMLMKEYPQLLRLHNEIVQCAHQPSHVRHPALAVADKKRASLRFPY